jgi:hypothetical protein
MKDQKVVGHRVENQIIVGSQAEDTIVCSRAQGRESNYSGKPSGG